MPPRAVPFARIYGLALAVRLVNALLSRAFFQPDEYWQSLEPAHRWVWGFGWVTWEWRVEPAEALHGDWWALVAQGGRGGIRSPLAVLPTAAVYALLKAAGCDSPSVLAIAPRLVQACIAASTDLAVFRLAGRVLGPNYANTALFASLTSFFNLHTATRTLSNSTETALTAWAWVYWPWEWLEPQRSELRGGATAKDKSRDEPGRSSLTLALSCVALAIIIRPSNAVIWLILGSQLLLRATAARRRRIVGATFGIGIAAAVLSFALDSVFYGTPTFTPLRFLHINVLQSISLFYGANSSHFYLSQGIPLLLATQLPFFLDGVAYLFRPGSPARTCAALKSLAYVLGGTTAAYSLLSHKEWRFLHPLLPIMHLFVALSLASRHALRPALAPSVCATLRTRPAHAALLLAAIPPAVYLTAFHGLGQARVPAYLHDTNVRAKSVGFLMPCHSTAWQAGMHAPWLADAEGERAWFLTCEPPVLGQDPHTYLDQSDYFYASPCTYLLSRLPASVDPSFPPSLPLPVRGRESGTDLGWTHAWPDRVVLFSSLLDVTCAPAPAPAAGTVGELLAAKGYVEERRLWNSLWGWHEDARRRGDVRVLRWRGAAMEGGLKDGEEEAKGWRVEL